MAEKKPTGLALMRLPFPENQISKLPKATKKQNDDLKADFKKGIRCQLCGGWHLPEVVHLDYVGHAALTDRLLDVDEKWTWEPLAIDSEGFPKLDKNGGLWIKLTVCGLTRLGYGNAEGKSGGDAIKEIIGDALRNAAMRFGAALDLWHKGDLHLDPPEVEKPKDPPAKAPEKPKDQPPSPAPKAEAAKETKTPVSPAETVMPSWGGTNKGKKLGALSTEVLHKIKDHLAGQLKKTPKPKHVSEIAHVYAQVKAVLVDRGPKGLDPTDDIPENNPHPEDEAQTFPTDDPTPPPPGAEDYVIPKLAGFNELSELERKPLKQITEKELRAAVKIIDVEMKRLPPKVSTAALFEMRSNIVVFFKEMGLSV